MLENTRILVVDDDDLVAGVCRFALAECGAEAAVAASVAEAVALACASAPDVILCDVGLPDGTVDDLCARLGEALPDRDIPFFVMSGGDLSNWPKRASVAGVFGKPFPVNELGPAIADALEHRRARGAWPGRAPG